jgi:F0F1-type ATP synthase delta subunit
MEGAYAQALWKSVQAGKSPSEAVHALVELLRHQGRLGLLVKIRKAFERVAALEHERRPRLYVAHQKDAVNARTQSGAPDAEVSVDASLIGGWRLEKRDELVDNSFKNHLVSLYESIAK